MNLLKLFAAPFNKIIDSVGKAIDDNVTNDEERLLLRNELVKITAMAESDKRKFEADYEKELSNRHALDMKSDSWLSKNIRPMTLIFLLGVVSMLSVTDGNIMGFVVKEAYVSLYESLLMTAFGFYFSMRSVEKIMKMKNGKSNE